MSVALTLTTRGDLELVISRRFAAPRRLVFNALTRSDLIPRWYGRAGWELIVCEADLRVGGKWRLVSRLPEGRDVGQRGVYREVEAPARFVRTENWEDWNPGELVTTVTLVERDGVTDFTDVTLFPSLEVRDMLLKAGLAGGAEEIYARLAAALSGMSVTMPGFGQS
jgi:uncharacterized protein YndB with AHSA1/START domain